MEKIITEKTMMSHPEDVRDQHRQASALSDIILGGQDGLVNVLGESGPWKSAPTISHVLITSSPNQITRPLPPPFHPPKSS